MYSYSEILMMIAFAPVSGRWDCTDVIQGALDAQAGAQ